MLKRIGCRFDSDLMWRRWIIQEVSNSVRKRHYVAMGKHSARGTIGREVGGRPNDVGQHNRATTSKRLIGHEAPGLPPIGGQHQNIGRRIGLRYRSLVTEAQQMQLYSEISRSHRQFAF